MLWIKALHIIFMVAWFAGLFYLPRLFVYHAQAENEVLHRQFIVMEHKLFWIITTPAGLLTAIFGFWLISFYSWQSFVSMHWLHIKLGMVGLLAAYHIYCGILMRHFKRKHNTRSHRWYRLFNEAPTLLLVLIVLLAVIKPI